MAKKSPSRGVWAGLGSRTSSPSVEVGKYPDDERRGDGDGVPTLLKHHLITTNYLSGNEVT